MTDVDRRPTDEKNAEPTVLANDQKASSLSILSPLKLRGERNEQGSIRTIWYLFVCLLVVFQLVFLDTFASLSTDNLIIVRSNPMQSDHPKPLCPSERSVEIAPSTDILKTKQINTHVHPIGDHTSWALTSNYETYQVMAGRFDPMIRTAAEPRGAVKRKLANLSDLCHGIVNMQRSSDASLQAERLSLQDARFQESNETSVDRRTYLSAAPWPEGQSRHVEDE